MTYYILTTKPDGTKRLYRNGELPLSFDDVVKAWRYAIELSDKFTDTRYEVIQ